MRLKGALYALLLGVITETLECVATQKPWSNVVHLKMQVTGI